MVGEIVHLQVGGAGNRLGDAFWKLLKQEHGLNENGTFVGNDENVLEKLGVYATNTSKGSLTHYTSRGILVDVDPDTINLQKLSGFHGSINTIIGNHPGTSNWGEGHYTYGVDISDDIYNITRRELEACEMPQGIQMFHSLGGGTGSGLGTLMLERLKQDHPNIHLTSFPVFPSNLMSPNMIESYNAVLAMKCLTRDADQIVFLDNEAFFNTCTKKLKMTNFQSYDDVNRLMSYFLSDVTSSFRFPAEVNNDMVKMASNLVLSPKLKCLMGGLAPVTKPGEEDAKTLTAQELTKEMFQPGNLTVDCIPEGKKYLATWAHFRGNFSAKTVNDQILDMKKARAVEFADNISSSVCKFPLAGVKASSSFVSNSTAISDMFIRVHKTFKKLLKRKTLLHLFRDTRMDISEFDEAGSNLKDLIDDYQNAAIADSK